MKSFDRIAMFIVDLCIVAVFAFLAVLFNKWWIVLFSCFFYLVERDEKDKGADEEKNEDD